MQATPINFAFILFCLFQLSYSLHLKGSWKTADFFRFLAKFGFQQTDSQDKNTQGYIYGNITAKTPGVDTSVTFVVVDSEYFFEYYGNSTLLPRNHACPAMFKKIDTIAYDRRCNLNGKEDFLRQIPCPQGQLCVDEDTPDWVIPGYQFTFSIQDTNQPRFWYISTVACQRNATNTSTCFWHDNDDTDLTLDYDVWVVNGHPFLKHINPFEHQFSFDHHDIFEVYLVFFVLYCFLVPIQLYALLRQKHLLPLLLTICMTMEFVGVIFNIIHVLKFAFDGEGVDLLKVTGNFIDNLAQCLFMLLLLLVVKGWTITRMQLPTRSRVILFTIWGTYTVANMALFVWNLTEVDIISDLDEWQTWPGWLILIFRICIMAWFLLELRETFLLEHSKEKMGFYLHFGAGFLVWFVYLPIVAVLCTQVSSLWRFKTLLSVMCSADYLSYCVMVHLLWPSRSAMYFNLKLDTPIPMEDLEFAGLRGNSLYLTDEEDSDDVFESTAFIKTRQEQHRMRQDRLQLMSAESPNTDMSLDESPLLDCEGDLERNRNCSPVSAGRINLGMDLGSLRGSLSHDADVLEDTKAVSATVPLVTIEDVEHSPGGSTAVLPVQIPLSSSDVKPSIMDTEPSNAVNGMEFGNDEWLPEHNHIANRESTMENAPGLFDPFPSVSERYSPAATNSVQTKVAAIIHSEPKSNENGDSGIESLPGWNNGLSQNNQR